jgi:hypothetical protein
MSEKKKAWQDAKDRTSEPKKLQAAINYIEELEQQIEATDKRGYKDKDDALMKEVGRSFQAMVATQIEQQLEAARREGFIAGRAVMTRWSHEDEFCEEDYTAYVKSREKKS